MNRYQRANAAYCCDRDRRFADRNRGNGALVVDARDLFVRGFVGRADGRFVADLIRQLTLRADAQAQIAQMEIHNDQIDARFGSADLRGNPRVARLQRRDFSVFVYFRNIRILGNVFR